MAVRVVLVSSLMQKFSRTTCAVIYIVLSKCAVISAVHTVLFWHKILWNWNSNIHDPKIFCLFSFTFCVTALLELLCHTSMVPSTL